jgi:hypothetical protein
LSYQDSKSNLLVTEGPTKYKSISDIDNTTWKAKLAADKNYR